MSVAGQSRKKTSASGGRVLGRQKRLGRPYGKAYPVRRPVRLSLLSDALLTYLYSKEERSDASSIIREAIDQYVTSSPAFDREEFMILLSSVAATLNDRPDDRRRLLDETARLFQATATEVSRELGVELPAQESNSDDK